MWVKLHYHIPFCGWLKLGIYSIYLFIIYYYFYFLATLHRMWDLSSPTRDPTHTLAVEVWSLNRWTAKEVPIAFLTLLNRGPVRSCEQIFNLWQSQIFWGYDYFLFPTQFLEKHRWKIRVYVCHQSCYMRGCFVGTRFLSVLFLHLLGLCLAPSPFDFLSLTHLAVKFQTLCSPAGSPLSGHYFHLCFLIFTLLPVHLPILQVFSLTPSISTLSSPVDKLLL